MHLVVNSENQAGIVAHLPHIANLEIVIELFQSQVGMIILSTHHNCPQGQIMLERWLEGTKAESCLLENQVLYYSLL